MILEVFVTRRSRSVIVPQTLLGLVCVTAWLFSPASSVTAQDEATAESIEVAAAAPPEVVSLLRSYLICFNDRDVSGLRELWAVDGVYEDLDAGETFSGQAAIMAAIEAVLDGGESPTLTAEATSIVALGEDEIEVAGFNQLNHHDGTVEAFEFVARVKKTVNGWRIASIQEQSIAPEVIDPAPMSRLSWMVGRWGLPDSTVEHSIRWFPGENFLIRTFGQPTAMTQPDPTTGFQVLGVDPISGGIRGTSYFADGSTAESQWEESPTAWVITSIHYLRDGGLASATQILKRVGDDQVTLKTVSHEIDGQIVANSPEVTFVRRSTSTQKPADHPLSPINASRAGSE